MNGDEREVSGDRFTVKYIIQGSEQDSAAAAEDICIEQTVEFPQELITDSFIRENIFGRIESFTLSGRERYAAEISFAAETAAGELTQFLNVIFGNISLKPGIIISEIDIPGGMFSGPRFGIEGIRGILKVYDRPLVASAIKPMGMTTSGFVLLARDFARGGVDIIKDDHGLSDQKFSCFKERVRACADAVNSENGGKTLYFPNITAPFDQITERAFYAKESGAGGVLVSPAITGFDCIRQLAADNNFALPVMSHPAFAGSFLSGGTGFTHGTLLGTLARISGADISVYPNFGGRFSFSKEQCADIKDKCRNSSGNLKRIFPAPGGGMNFSNVPEMTGFYGSDVVYLMGGGLFKRSPDLAGNCRELKRIVSGEN